MGIITVSKVKEYSIYKQFFVICKDRCKVFIFEQIPYISQNMPEVFLFGESFDFAKMRAPQIAYNDYFPR
jgi:carboxypeptidase C (cathepsin A)